MSNLFGEESHWKHPHIIGYLFKINETFYCNRSRDKFFFFLALGRSDISGRSRKYNIFYNEVHVRVEFTIKLFIVCRL